jgi:hypothetical protein
MIYKDVLIYNCDIKVELQHKKDYYISIKHFHDDCWTIFKLGRPIQLVSTYFRIYGCHIKEYIKKYTKI